MRIASCSFGKDSLAAIITEVERGAGIDEIVYCRIMFNKEISAELPEHEDFIHNHAIPLLHKRYGLKTTIVQADRTYCDQLYTTYKKGKRVGWIYGFPILIGPWCNSRLKIAPIKAWQKTAGEYTEIIGIAADEEKRINRRAVQKAVLPLVENGITEKQAFDICKRNDLLSPAYNNERTRLGCWFCHNQKVGELRRLRKEMPNLWEKLLIMDKDSPRTFTPRATVRELDERFLVEDKLSSIGLGLGRKGQIKMEMEDTRTKRSGRSEKQWRR
ncbi:MAG: phosphoadenosine phosphosulfate reductase [Clostridiales bacterium]|nr:phosphoadenosine phosphosulfate reductase [Clostridiales bacterium]